MQNFRNYYDILGVARDSTVDEIKKSFRRLARQYHPDLNPGDKKQRRNSRISMKPMKFFLTQQSGFQYDQFGKFWQQRGFQGGQSPRSGGRSWNGRGGDRSATGEVDFSEFPDFNSFVDQLLNRRTAPGTSTSTSTGSRDYFRPGTTKTTYTVPRAGRRDAEARLGVPLEKAYLGDGNEFVWKTGDR